MLKNRAKPHTRRDVLKIMAVSSFGLAAVPGAVSGAAKNEESINLQSPAGLLSAAVKMRGTLDERLAYIWLRGLRYTLVDGEAVPLCGYLGGAITRYRQLADDMFEFLLYEVSYYTDIETGEVLDTLRMPYTDNEVKVPLYRTGPGRHVLMIANEEELEWSRELTTTEELAKAIAPDAKVFYRFNLRPAIQFGDQVWIRSDSFTSLVPNDPSNEPMFYKEAITYQANKADFDVPDATSVNSTLSFAIATAWRPWMQMTGIDGHTVTDGIGGKVLDIFDLPDDFVRFTKKHHPDVLDDPAALLKS